MTWLWPLPTLIDGRRPVISSGYRSADRPTHYGADLAYEANASDPPFSGRATVERTRRYYSPPMPVLAVAAGTVTEASARASERIRGRVRLQHADGSSTVYYHLESVAIDLGAEVEAGAELGTSGPAGDYVFRHLHLEYYAPGARRGNGNQSDPEPMLRVARLAPSSPSSPPRTPGGPILVALLAAAIL